MENLIKVEIKLIYLVTEDEDDRVDLDIDAELSETNFQKFVTLLKDAGATYEGLKFGPVRPFVITTYNFKEAIRINDAIHDFLSNNKQVREEDTTPKNNSISSEIDYIAKNLDGSDLVLQLAEEAAELSQACLKYVRACRGNNPTKDSEEVYLKNVLEELTDVRVSADVLNIEEDIDTYINKIHRWADRIRSKNAGEKK